MRQLIPARLYRDRGAKILKPGSGVETSSKVKVYFSFIFKKCG